MTHQQIQIGGFLLLAALTACTAVSNSASPTAVPRTVQLGVPPELPVEPSLMANYSLKHHSGNETNNGKHLGHRNRAGKPVEERTFVSSESLYVAQLSAGKIPPASSIVQATIPFLELTYGPINDGSVTHALMSMEVLRAADANARSITFVHPQTSVLVVDAVGRFQANRVPYGVSPDTYSYARVYLDAMTGEPFSTLLSHTPIDDRVTPIPTPIPSATPVPSASPTPVPTLSPTPVPTPTPTPVPTASPTPPAINPIGPGKLGQVSDIEVDDQGNLYLSGYDYGTTADSRVMRVTPNLQLDATPVFDAYSTANDMEIIGDRLYIFELFPGIINTVDLNTRTLLASQAVPNQGVGGLGKSLDNQLLFGDSTIGTTKTLKMKKGEPSSASTLFSYTYTNATTTYGYSPIQIVTDENNNPVWTSQQGIATYDYNQSMVVTMKAGNYFSLATTGSTPTTYLTATNAVISAGNSRGSREIYFFNPASPSTTPQITVEPALPSNVGDLRIERGADGFFYLLLFDYTNPHHTHSDKIYVNKYRLEWTATGIPKLVKVLDMVNSVN